MRKGHLRILIYAQKSIQVQYQWITGHLFYPSSDHEELQLLWLGDFSLRVYYYSLYSTPLKFTLGELIHHVFATNKYRLVIMYLPLNIIRPLISQMRMHLQALMSIFSNSFYMIIHNRFQEVNQVLFYFTACHFWPSLPYCICPAHIHNTIFLFLLLSSAQIKYKYEGMA